MAQEMIAAVHRAVEQGLPEFQRSLESMSGDWASFGKLSQLNEELARPEKLVPHLAAYRKAVAERRTAIVTALRDGAETKIAAAGGGFADIESVLDTAETLLKPFRAAKETAHADALMGIAATRVDQLAAMGLPDAKQRIAEIPPTRDSLDDLNGLIREYADLERHVPAFGAFRETAVSRYVEIERTLCTAAKARAQIDPKRADTLLVAEDETITLGQLVCDVDYALGALIVSPPPPGGIFRAASTDLVLNYKSGAGLESTITLKPSPQEDDKGAIIGVALEANGEKSELTREQWLAFLDKATTVPVSGKPDREGLTVCDRLAADPDDSGKVGAGVPADKVDSTAAIEACIAAIEFDPAFPRLKYQLGRALFIEGADAEAKRFLQISADQGYGAALMLLGDIATQVPATHGEAIELYRKAAALNYPGATERIAAVGLIDFEKGWPATGKVRLQCNLETYLKDLPGDDNDQIVLMKVWLTVDLDTSTAHIHEYTLASRVNKTIILLVENSSVPIEDTGDAFLIEAHRYWATIEAKPVFRLNKNTLFLSHKQFLKTGHRDKSEVDAGGNCSQLND